MVEWPKHATPQTAVEAQPNSAEASGNLALILAYTGSHEEAVTEMDRALRLDPTPSPAFRLLAGIVFYTAQVNSRAVPLLESARDALPNAEAAREFLTSAYVFEGDQARGIEEKAKLLALFPESNLTYYSYLYDYWRADDLKHHLEGLRTAGIPDWPFGFVGKEADQVVGEALRNLINDQTWTGKHKNGTAFVQFFDNAGNTAYRSANTNITGTVELQGNKVCEKFAGYFLDRMVCSQIYRNNEAGQPEAQYVQVTPQALKFFSPAP
jgi:adenylate cyclase